MEAVDFEDPANAAEGGEEENTQEAEENNGEGNAANSSNADSADNGFSEQPGRPKKYNKVCPSVLKGEPCWALSRGKPCHYARHEKNEKDGTGGGGPPAEKQRVHSVHLNPVSSNVYVCHLPISMTKDQLHSMFSPYGTIRECKLLVEPKTQEPKGVAFIHFTNPQEAKNAIEGIHGLVITGSDKALECRMAKPNPVKGPGQAFAEFRAKAAPPGRGGGPPARRDFGPPRGPPPRDYDRYYEEEYPPPRGYGEYGRRIPPPYEEEYDYGPMRRGPPGPRPSPYGRPEPRRGPPPRGEFDAYGPPPRRREDYDPYLEAEYYGGPAYPPARGGPPPGFGGPRADPRGEFGGPRGEFGGPPRGEFGGPRGEFGGPPRGEYGGPRGEFAGPRGDYGGPRAEFGGPRAADAVTMPAVMGAPRR